VKIAIIGAGIAGLSVARQLHLRHDVRVYEVEERPGGHARTVDIDIDGVRAAVDTAFLVFNEHNYPRFSALLAELGVEGQPAPMGLAVRLDASGLEYSSASLGGMFAGERNLARRELWALVAGVLRLRRRHAYARDDPAPELTLRDLVSAGQLSDVVVDGYIIPAGAAIWSCSREEVLDMPAAAFLAFLRNHGFLGGQARAWRTIPGGSRRYVERLVEPFRDRLALSSPVRRVERAGGVVHVQADGRGGGVFDACVLAIQPDLALRLLADPSPLEREVLGAFRSTEAQVTLHTDDALLPRRPACRSSWNVRVFADPRRAIVTYDLRHVQSLPFPRPLYLSLDADDVIDPRRVVHRASLRHPRYTPAMLRAQERWPLLNGRRATYYCGAAWGDGFHEAGIGTALAVARLLHAPAMPADEGGTQT